MQVESPTAIICLYSHVSLSPASLASHKPLSASLIVSHHYLLYELHLTNHSLPVSSYLITTSFMSCTSQTTLRQSHCISSLPPLCVALHKPLSASLIISHHYLLYELHLTNHSPPVSSYLITTSFVRCTSQTISASLIISHVMSMFCNVMMLLLLYAHICVTRTGWKTRPRPKTVILSINKSINQSIITTSFMSCTSQTTLCQSHRISSLPPL